MTSGAFGNIGGTKKKPLCFFIDEWMTPMIFQEGHAVELAEQSAEGC